MILELIKEVIMKPTTLAKEVKAKQKSIPRGIIYVSLYGSSTLFFFSMGILSMMVMMKRISIAIQYIPIFIVFSLLAGLSELVLWFIFSNIFYYTAKVFYKKENYDFSDVASLVGIAYLPVFMITFFFFVGFLFIATLSFLSIYSFEEIVLGYVALIFLLAIGLGELWKIVLFILNMKVYYDLSLIGSLIIVIPPIVVWYVMRVELGLALIGVL